MPTFCGVFRKPSQSPVSVSRFRKVPLRGNLDVFSNSFRKLHRSTNDEGVGASLATEGGVAGLSKFTPSAKLTPPDIPTSMSIARKASSAAERLKTLRPITKSKTASREKVNVFAWTILPSSNGSKVCNLTELAYRSWLIDVIAALPKLRFSLTAQTGF